MDVRSRRDFLYEDIDDRQIEFGNLERLQIPRSALAASTTSK